MCPAEGETAAADASATRRKEDAVSQGQWAPRATPGLPGCRASQGCRAAKATRAKEEPPGQRDPKEMWEQEVTAAMGPGETQAHKDPPAPRDFPAPPGPKDPKDRKVNLMHCLKRTATNTGVNLGSLDWSDSRVLLAALDLWGPWVQLEPLEDRDHPDPLDPKDSQATEDWASTDRRVKRAT